MQAEQNIYRGQINFGAYGYDQTTGTIEELKDWAWGEGSETLWIYYGESIRTIGHYVYDESKPSCYRRVNTTEYYAKRKLVYLLTRAEMAG